VKHRILNHWSQRRSWWGRAGLPYHPVLMAWDSARDVGFRAAVLVGRAFW